MKKHSANRVLIGALALLLTAALISPAGATLAGKTIEVLTGVTIYVNGVEMRPTDANGKPVETFVYNGTTYVPLRAVSQSLGENVQYDGATQSVYIGDDPRMTNYLVNVCPPYQESGYYHESFKMDGVLYPANGFHLGGTYWGGNGPYALFNLNGKYASMTATVGHLDGWADGNSRIFIYLDGVLSQTIELDKECLAKQITIPLNGALQLKIDAPLKDVGNNMVGFANAVLH